MSNKYHLPKQLSSNKAKTIEFSTQIHSKLILPNLKKVSIKAMDLKTIKV